MSKRRKALRTRQVVSLVGAVLMVGSLSGVAQAKTAAGSECSGPVHAKTLVMGVEIERRLVRAGDIARFDVTVTRRVAEREGPTQPAADAQVWITVSPSHRPSWNTGITDDTGKVQISVPIRHNAKRGWVDAIGYAAINHAGQGGCSAEESGGWQASKVVRILSKKS